MIQRISKATIIFIALVFLKMSIAQAGALPDFTGLVNKNSAAVVNISTHIKKVEAAQLPPGYNLPNIPEDSPFHDFFKKYFDGLPKGHAPSPERASMGSGFIISNDGYIITNNHVVQNAKKIIVKLNDRREYTAELIGTDKKSDIAVLKIEATDLPTLKLGSSSNLKVGEWVLAIGSPFGFDYSVTAGIISAIGRSLPNENYVPFIQTDVAINPGNSGGPLFNLDGEVIGVNSQIYSRTGGFMGLSFAVPIDVVENVYRQLRKNGHVARGWLGVLIQDVTRDLAESFGMDHPHGALIAKVLADGPAEKANFEVGDIVVKFNGKKVSFSSDLPPLVGSTPVNTLVPVEIIRRSKHKIIQVKISELPTDDADIAKKGNKEAKAHANSLNVIVKDLKEDQRKELGINQHGVLVEKVDSGPAQESGVRQGDVILLLNNIKVKTTAHFNKILNDLPKGRSIPILIQRQGNPIFLALKIDE